MSLVMRLSSTVIAACLLLAFGLTGCTAPPDPGAQRSTTQAKELRNRMLATQTDR
jgi:starvation-inducible outer membrane lipoprotein